MREIQLHSKTVQRIRQIRRIVSRVEADGVIEDEDAVERAGRKYRAEMKMRQKNCFRSMYGHKPKILTNELIEKEIDSL